jgi:hypothetical protein
MAVFQAARARTTTVPRRDARIAILGSRDRGRAFVRPRLIADATAAVPRIRPAAVLVVGVLFAAMLGFAYLTQTLTSTATAVAIEKLQAEQQRLYRIVQTREAVVRSNAASPLVLDRATALGLTELSKPTVPSAR